MEADFDPYLILGVSSHATDDEIQKAYRRLALTMHPDHNQHDARAKVRFQQVQRAYDLLRDSERRRAFDSGNDSDLPQPQRTEPNDAFREMTCPICSGMFTIPESTLSGTFHCPLCNAHLTMPGTRPAPPPPPPPPDTTPTSFAFAKPSDFRLDKSKPRRPVPMWSFWTFLILGFVLYRGIVALNRQAGPVQQVPQRQPEAQTANSHSQTAKPSHRQDRQQKGPPGIGFPIAESFDVSGRWVCERQTYRGEASDIRVKMTLDLENNGTFKLIQLFMQPDGEEASEVLQGKWERFGNDVSLEHQLRLPDWIHEVKIEQLGLSGSAENPALNFTIAGHAWPFRKETSKRRTKFNFGLPPLEPLEYVPNNIDSRGTLRAW